MRRAIPLVAGVGLVLLYAMRGGAYNPVVFEGYGLVIWWVLAAGLASGVLPRMRPSRPMLAVMSALVAYAGWTALSLIWSVSAQNTFLELARTLDYLGLIALIACSLDRQSLRPAAEGVALGALLVCLLSVLSRLVPGAFPANLIGGTLDTKRLSYPFGYWNAVGAWSAMSIAAGLGLSAHLRRYWQRAVLLGLCPTAALATYLSYSRAGLIDIAVGVVAVLILSSNRIAAAVHALAFAAGAGAVVAITRGQKQIANAAGTRGAGTVILAILAAFIVCGAVAAVTRSSGLDRVRTPRRLARAAVAGLLLVLVIAGAAFGPHAARSAWNSFTAGSANVQAGNPSSRLLNLSGSRYVVWKAAIKAFDAHPLDGTGSGTFQYWWNRHGTTPESLLDVHNIWLQNMAELGVPGLILIVAFVLAALFLLFSARTRSRRRSGAGPVAGFGAAFVVFLVAATVDWMWEETAVTVLALAGLAAVGCRTARDRAPLRIPLRAGLAVCAVLAALIQLPGLISQIELDRSQAAARAGNSAHALSLAAAAVSAEPWSASAHQQRGLVLESVGRYTAAAQELRLAIRHARFDYTSWLVLARVQTERGKLPEALRDYDRAKQLRPLASVFALGPTFRSR